MKKWLAIYFVALIAILAFPYGIYGVGLMLVQGKPILAKSAATAQQRFQIWRHFSCTGTPELRKLSPYTYFPLFEFGRREKWQPDPSSLLAWQVARDYNIDQMPGHSMGWWHWAGIAMQIWLTRNWTIDQLLDKNFELIEQKKLKLTHKLHC